MSLDKARELLAKNPNASWYEVDDDLEDLFGKRPEIGKALWSLFRDGSWVPTSGFISCMEDAEGAFDAKDVADLLEALAGSGGLQGEAWNNNLTWMLEKAGAEPSAAIWPDIPDPMRIPMGYRLAVLGALSADDLPEEVLQAEAHRIASRVSGSSDVENLVRVFGEERSSVALAHAGTLDDVDIWSDNWIPVAMKTASVDQQAGILARCDYDDSVLKVAQVVLDSALPGLAKAIEGYDGTFADMGKQAQAWVLCMLDRGTQAHADALLDQWKGSVKKLGGAALARVDGANEAVARALKNKANYWAPWSAVVHLPTPEVLAALCERIKKLGRGDSHIADSIAKSVSKLPEEAAATLLANPVGKCAQRQAWTRLLGITLNPEVIPLVVQLLGDSSKQNVQMAVNVLKWFKATARPALEEGAKARKKAIREACAELLAKLDSAPAEGSAQQRLKELQAEHDDVTKEDPVGKLLSAVIHDEQELDQARRDELLEELGDVFWVKAWGYAKNWTAGKKAWLALKPEGEIAVLLGVVMARGYGSDEETVLALLGAAPPTSVREAIEQEKMYNDGPFIKWLAKNDDKAAEFFTGHLDGRTAWSRERAVKGIRALADRACLLPLLNAGKAALRQQAAELLAEQPPKGAAKALEARLKKEKSEKVRGAMVNALTAIEEADATSLNDLPVTAKAHKELDACLARAGKRLKGKYGGPKLTWASGKALSKHAMLRVMSLLAQEGPQDHPLGGLRRHVTGAAELLAWLRKEHEGTKEARLGWVLFAAGVLAEDDEMLDYGRPLDDLARGGAFKEAENKLIVLGRQGGNPGLQWVDHWARKARSQGLKERAGDLLQESADALGVSRDALTETLVPDMDFAADRTRPWPHGDRDFTLKLAYHNELQILHEGAVKKNLPGARKGEDADAIKASKKKLTALKKQLKQATKAQLERMEDAMVTGRRWTREAWTALYVDNPVLSSLARTALWSDGEVIFRVAEDGSAATVDDEVYKPGEQIHLVHPLDLEDEQRATWSEVFADYEIIVPWDFFQRERFEPTEEEADAKHVLQLKGRKIPAAKLRWGLERKYSTQTRPVSRSTMVVALAADHSSPGSSIISISDQVLPPSALRFKAKSISCLP